MVHHQLPDSDRLEFDQLRAAVRLDLQPTRVWLWSAVLLYYTIPSLLLAVVGWLVWWPASVAAVAVWVIGLWKDRLSTTTYFERSYERTEFIAIQAGLVGRRARAENPEQVNGVKSGTWVCDKNEYDDVAKEYRRKHPQSAAKPWAEYRLAIACHQINGNTRRVAFSDGSTRDWDPRSRVYSVRMAASPQDSFYSDPEGGKALEILVDMLVPADGILSLDVLMKSFEVQGRASLARAVQIGVLWGIVNIKGRVTVTDIVRSIRDDSLSEIPMLQLTEAGRVWRLCSEESRKARERKAQMSSKQGPKFNFYKGSNNNVNYVEGDLIGQTTNFATRPADDDVLKALDRLLQADDLPWDDPEVESLRQVIERAVDRHDVRQAGLRDAVSRLLTRFGGGIALGVAGNSVYDVLKAFVS